jgi:hypothetical protein
MFGGYYLENQMFLGKAATEFRFAETRFEKMVGVWVIAIEG